MLKGKKGEILILALAAVLFLSGCLQELKTNDRLECMQLTSYSQTSVPECSSQEQCFDSVNANIFPFPDSVFSPDTRQSLMLYKNHLARAWLYYSRAMGNIKAIYNICDTGAGLEKLPNEVSELNSHLRSAFSNLDSAAKTSFEILLLENADLEAEGIDKIKEEGLYDFYILLNNNINELKTKSLKPDTDTYIGFYSSRISQYNGFVRKHGFRETIIGEHSALDFINYTHKPFFRQMKEEEMKGAGIGRIFYALLFDSVSGIINYFTSWDKIEQATEALLKFPSFEVLNSFNDFAGSENSVAKKFSDLLADGSKARSEAIQNVSRLKVSVSDLLASTQEMISLIDADAYASFDQNFLAEMYSLLGQETSIVTQQYSVKDIASLKSDSSAELSRKKQEYEKIIEDEFLSKISLGERLSRLKALHSELRLLGSSIDYASTEIVSGLHILCDARIELIKSQLSESSYSNPEASHSKDDLSKASDLKIKLEYKLSQYANSPESKKLLFCKPAVKLYNEFLSALADYSQYKISLGDEIDSCFSFLSSISAPGNGMQDIALQYEKLKAVPKPYADASAIRDSCLRLKESAEIQLNQIPDAEALSNNYRDSKLLFSELSSLSKKYPEAIPPSLLERLKARVSGIDSYFDSGNIKFAKALPVIDELNESSSALADDLMQALKDFAVMHIEESFHTEILSSETPVAGQAYSAKLRLSFKSPLSMSLDEPLALNLPVDVHSELALEYAVPEVESAVFDGKSINLSLSSLPTGSTSALFDLNTVMAETKEETEIVFLDSSKAVLHREITISAYAQIPKLRVETSLPNENLIRNEIFAYRGEEQIDFSLSQNILAVFVENAENSQKIDIYFAVSNPVIAGYELIDSGLIDANTMRYDYSISLKNALGLEISSTKITLPFAVDEERLESKEFFDSKGQMHKIEILPQNKIAFVINSLLPKQTAVYSLTLVVKDYKAYWESLLSALNSELTLLSASAEPEIAISASSLLEELLLFDAENLNDSQIASIASIAADAEELKSKESSVSSFLAEFSFLKLQIEDELENLGKETTSLSAVGYSDYASKIKSLSDSSKAHIAKAEELRDSKKYNDSLQELFNAKSALSEKSDITLSGIISSERELLSEKLHFLLAQSQGIDDFALSSAKEELLLLDDKIARSLMKEDYLDAKQNLDEFSKKLSSYGLLLNEQLKAKASAAYESIRRFSFLLSQDGLQGKADELNKLLDSISPDVLGNINYVLPITKTRLSKIALRVNELMPSSLNRKIDSFIAHYEDENYFEALGLSDSFQESLDKKLREAELLDNEVSSALESIKNDAELLYSTASSKLASSLPDEKISSLVSRAKSELNNEAYLKSIALSGNAIMLLSLAPGSVSSAFSIPFSILPLLGIAFAVLFVRYKRSARAKTQPVQLQKIPRKR